MILPVNILPSICKLFKFHILTWVPLSPMMNMCYESSEKHECLYLLAISTGKCLIGWWEWSGEYSMSSFYSNTAKKCPSGLYSTCMMGLVWCDISWTTLVVYMSNILKIPDLNPAMNCSACGFPEMHVHISVFG